LDKFINDFNGWWTYFVVIARSIAKIEAATGVELGHVCQGAMGPEYGKTALAIVG
jgi:hypothetical protein